MSTWFGRSIVVGVGLGALCAAACGSADGVSDPAAGAAQAGDPASATPTDTGTHPTSVSGEPDDRAGQTGSPGQAECQTDPDCDKFAEDSISSEGQQDASLSHRSASCDHDLGKCSIVYTGSAGCSAHVRGPFFDCALDDAEIIQRDRDALTPSAEACQAASSDTNTDTGSGSAACAEPEAPQFFPRDPNEWQGMLIESSSGPFCEHSETCGLARACVDAMCTRCTEDSQCAEGEGCVLDQCVRQELIGCRHAADCGSAVKCVLSGYTGGTPRGNEDMRAYCVGGGAGSAG